MLPERDGDGYLLAMDEWSPEVMHAMAEADDFNLTEEMVGYINQCREMYDEFQVVPPLRAFSKATGGDRKGTHLNELFGGGPMKYITKYGGLPKPTGCV